MKSCIMQIGRSLAMGFCLVLIWSGGVVPAAQDSAKTGVKDLDTPRDFPAIQRKDQWVGRARGIREHVLVGCGLWPLPEKTPLQAHVFGKVERDGYSVEKVYFQTYPGFYLGGNLYRPLGHGAGPFPAILNPHGHWSNGRMADNDDGSIAARCISFARQGMIAFSYDMVGFNDSYFPDHGVVPAADFYKRHNRFATNHADLLWNISLMGLQTWNSVRAVDFLVSLGDVDRNRLACTGESGGGTQTFMLGAVEDRLAAQAPIVMVSHTMQGGCLCENAPGLRVEYSNMEIAAAAAPRPQMLVAATGDWTKATLEVEGPAIAHIYDILGKPGNFHYVRFDFGHNYNRTSREAVYEWMDHQLLGAAAPASSKEAPYRKEPDEELRVWPDGKLPSDALSEPQFIQSLVRAHQAQWEALVPRDKNSFESYQSTFLPAWRHTLQLIWTETEIRAAWKPQRVTADYLGARLDLQRPGASGPLSIAYFTPPIDRAKAAAGKSVIVLAGGDGTPAPVDSSGNPTGLAAALVNRGHTVLAILGYATTTPRDQFTNYFCTYNRTEVQERLRDLLTVCLQAGQLAPAKEKDARPKVVLCGAGRAGLWALLAAPAVDAVIADVDQLDVGDDQELLAPDLFCPGIRNIGAFEGVAMLAAPHPLLVHNAGSRFPTSHLEATYRALGSAKKFKVQAQQASQDAMERWITAVK
jgi:hypothetical protein